MSEVVAFKPRVTDLDMIFVCDCGCATFNLRGDGEAVCAVCNSLANIGSEGKWWREPEVVEIADKAPIISTCGNSDGGLLAERIAKKRVQDADWIIHGTSSGTISAWSREFMETPKQVKWLRRGVKIGLQMILDEKPK